MRLINTFILLSCLISSNYTFALINAKSFKTTNNIEIILLQDNSTDFISLNLGFKGAGAIADEANKAGLGSMMMDLIFRSNAGGMDRHAKARKMKELGILSGINYSVTNDDIEIGFKAPQENLKQSLELLNTILFKAEKNNVELNKIKDFGISNTSISNSDEETFALNTLKADIFKGHPYANPAKGTQQGIQSLNLSDIEQAFKQRLAKNNLIVSVVGNIDKKTISSYIDSTFSALPNKENMQKAKKIEPNLDGKVKVIFKDSPQSVVVFAQKSIPFADKDFYSFLLANRILGGEPFTSRLWIEIREKLGMAYNIGTNVHSDNDLADVMIGDFKCNTQNTKRVIELIKEEWIILKNNGVTKEEFENAKTGLIGQYALRFISPEQTSYYLLQNRLMGFDINHINERNDKIKALTIEDINKAAKEYLHPEQLSFVVVGDIE